jgi:hypothetical protein
MQDAAMTRFHPAGIAAIAALSLSVALPAVAQSSGDGSFALVNRGASPVQELYVTPAGDANWGRDRLHGQRVAPGAAFRVLLRRDGNCIFDVRAVFADGRREERRGLNTCSLDDVAVGGPEAPRGAATAQGNQLRPGEDASFRLVNRGREAISALFATPSGDADWGQNRLPEGGVPAGTSSVIRIARTDTAQAQCLFDLRVVFADHRALEKRHADLCRITDLPVP